MFGCVVSFQVFVRDCESIGTRISIGGGGVFPLLFPAIWICTRTATGKLVFTEVVSVVSQASYHCVPSKHENLMPSMPLISHWSSTSSAAVLKRLRVT